MRSPSSFLLLVAGLLGLTGVAAGAFGAHGLKATFAVTGGAENWKTAVFYQLIHAVALLALAPRPESAIRGVAVAWLAGVVLFSGSLYALALGLPAKFIWPLTPLGGVALLGGWARLTLLAFRPSPP